MSRKPSPSAPAAAPLPGTVGHKADLTTRFAMGVLLIAVALAAVWFGGWPFRVLVLIGAAIMLAEWAEMHRVAWPWTWAGVAMLAALLLGGVEYFYAAGEADTIAVGYGEEMLSVAADTFAPLLYLVAAAVAVGLLLALASRRSTLGWGFAYVGLPALALLVLSWVDPGVLLWVLVVTWSTDIGAFFAGKAIGGPRLAPKISPAKTWAGLAGGAAAAGIVGYYAASFLGFDQALDAGSGEAATLFQAFFYLGAPMAVVAQAGDLYESWVKRRCGVKDSGTILPGHGGVLDRCDGLIAVVTATLAFLMIGLWLG